MLKSTRWITGFELRIQLSHLNFDPSCYQNEFPGARRLNKDSLLANHYPTMKSGSPRLTAASREKLKSG
jgi:hypothetical protein